jgi:RHS repeat-associated protein
LTKNSNTTNFLTYNFYDNKDRITTVIPPAVTFAERTTLGFLYTYDGADNMLTKKVPDAALVTMKYTNRDQLALIQDGKLLAQNKWRCMQYDDYGRPIKTGLYSGVVTTPVPTTTTPNEMDTESIYGTAGIEKGKIKTTKARILDGGSTWLQTTFTYDNFGRVLSTAGNNHLLPADLAAETITYLYDYADHVLKDTRVSKSTATASNTITQKHNYDHWGRNMQNTHQIGTGGEHTINQLGYNWKNELIERNIGKAPAAANFLQSLDYTYNAMGWLLTLNASGLGGTSVGTATCPTNPTMPNPGASNATPDLNDLFYLELKYDQLQSGLSGTAQKNGNISQIIWRVRGRERQAYSYNYDIINRLTLATYSGLTDAGVVNNAGAWNESLVYNARGNITTMTRTGKHKATPTATCWTDGQIDNLSYSYNTGTNRLKRVIDSAPVASKANGWNNVTGAAPTVEYTYDPDGNMTTDPYKGMTVTYNHQNLPTLFAFPGNKTVAILYNGAGQKLRKTVTDNGTLVYRQDYVSGIEYRTTTAATLSLESIFHSEGRVFNTTVGTTSAMFLRYEYTIKDHLGNARLTFTDKNNNGRVDVDNTANNEVLQENHYYAFGMNMSGPWTNDVPLDNRYQYNSKELNDDFGLNLSDYGARWYDASIGRWWSVDPMAEKYVSCSPYVYVNNSPISLVDPDGMQWVTSEDKKVADRLQKTISRRISSEKNNIAMQQQKENSIRARIATNGSSASLERQLGKAVSSITNSQTMITELTQASNDLTTMETIDQKFTFVNIGEQGVSQTFVKDDIITMEFTTDANAIHESTHAMQINNKEIIGGDKGKNRYRSTDVIVNAEIAAYRRQFAFDQNSVTNNVPSYWGQANSFSDITKHWLIGINSQKDFNGEFIYANNVLGRTVDPKIVKAILDQAKNEKK